MLAAPGTRLNLLLAHRRVLRAGQTGACACVRRSQTARASMRAQCASCQTMRARTQTKTWRRAATGASSAAPATLAQHSWLSGSQCAPVRRSLAGALPGEADSEQEPTSGDDELPGLQQAPERQAGKRLRGGAGRLACCPQGGAGAQIRRAAGEAREHDALEQADAAALAADAKRRCQTYSRSGCCRRELSVSTFNNLPGSARRL